jgi:hypothetical protein
VRIETGFKHFGGNFSRERRKWHNQERKKEEESTEWKKKSQKQIPYGGEKDLLVVHFF